MNTQATIAPKNVGTVDQASHEAIRNLYSEWRAVRDRDFPTDEQSQANYLIYAELQEKITSMVPETAQDLAIQLVVETDYGGSDYREIFFERVLAVANEPATTTDSSVTIDPDHQLASMADEIDGLLNAAVIPSLERDELYSQWLDEAKAAGVLLGSAEGMAISQRIGHSEKDNEAAAFWTAIGELQEQSRHHQPSSLAGLHAKARILRHSMAAEFSDDVPRGDQDWHVLLFNEFMDAVACLASQKRGELNLVDASNNHDLRAGGTALDRLVALLRVASDLANNLDKHIEESFDAGGNSTADHRQCAA